MSLYDTRAIDKVKVVMMKGETGGGGGGASALADLSDVDISYPYDGQSLIYDSDNQKWVNGNAYTAGAGIILNNKQFRNAYRNARLGKIDTISSGYAHTEIDMQTSESVGSGSVVILKSEVSGTANTLRIQKSSTPSDVLDRPFYEWDGTATSVNITAGDLLIITFDMTTGYRAQVLDIIPESSGGGDTSQVKYQIVTKSTGGNDASITVKKYVDGTLKTSTDYLYSVLEGGVTIDGLISLEYGTIPLSYTYILLQASTTHSAGYAYSWGYNQTVDFEDTFTVVNIVPINRGGTGNAYGYIRTGAASGSTIGTAATAEGYDTTASGEYSHAEGIECVAEGDSSHAEGSYCAAEGWMSHAEGSSNIASGIASHAEGGYFNSGDNNTASGDSAHAEGAKTTASGDMSHAEGYNTTASGGDAHAEGSGTTASFAHAHAEGYNTTASGNSSHAGGTTSVASGLHSFAHGQYVNAGYAQQTAIGRYNDNKSTSLFEIGNGADANSRSNAFEVDASGNVTASGDVTDGQGNKLSEAIQWDSAKTSVKKNLLPLSLDDIKALNTHGTWNGNAYTYSGVTFTILTDSDNNVIGIDVDGTAQVDDFVGFRLPDFTSANGVSYTINGCPSGGSNNTYSISWYNHGRDTGSGATSTGTDDTRRVVIEIKNGVVMNHSKFYPMIRLASIADNTFAPYILDNVELASSKTDNSVVGPVESGTTASRAYAVGEHFIRNDKFCTAIASIASGATLTLNTNYVEGTIAGVIEDLTSYLEQTVTLSTSAETTATFTNAKITANSLIDLAVSEWGLIPSNVVVASGTCTVTMPQVDSAHSVTVRIYVR